MREIKFRAWDTAIKRMFIPSTSMNPKTFFCGVNSGGFEVSVYRGKGRWEKLPVMQFTGLRDKNGREIYEGDIIVGKGYPFFDDGKPNYVADVEWCFAGFHGVLRCVNPQKRGISDGINEPLEEGKAWEVVGELGLNRSVEELEKVLIELDGNGVSESKCARCGCDTEAHFRKETKDYPDGICSICNCPRWTTMPETKQRFIKVLRPSGGR